MYTAATSFLSQIDPSVIVDETPYLFKGYGQAEVPLGQSILQAAQKAGAPEGFACGGVCACTTCHLWIKDQTGISEADDDEIDRMDMAADQQLESRLGCQAVITKPGEYVVEIPKWNRNYTSEGKPLAMAEGK